MYINTYYFFPFGQDSKRCNYCTRYIQPQLRGELVRNITGPGQRTKRDFDTSKMSQRWLRRSGWPLRPFKVPDPLRQVLDSKHAVHNLPQRPWPLASLVSASVASMGAQVCSDLCLIFFLLCFSLHIGLFLDFTLMAQRFLKRRHSG